MIYFASFILFSCLTFSTALYIFTLDLSFDSILLLIAHAFLRLPYLILFLSSKRFSSIACWLFFEMAFFTYMHDSSGVVFQNHLSHINEKSREFSILLGSFLILIYILTSFVFYFFPRRIRFNRIFEYRYYINKVSLGRLNFYFFLFLVFTFLSSLVSFFLGITVMGQEVTVLPFKMTGILNNYRNIIVPITFVLFLIFYDKHGRSFMVISFFMVWSILESYIKLSKGVIILNFLLIVIWHINSGNKITIPKLCLTIFFGLLMVYLFTFIQDVREGYSQTNKVTVSESSIDNISFIDSFNKIILRSFLDGLFLAKFHQYNNDGFISKEIEVSGSPALFHTHVVDGVPIGLQHSSGSSSFAEAFALGGILLASLVSIIYALITFIIDEIIKIHKEFLLLAIFVLYQTLFSTNIGLISLFFYNFSYLFTVFIVCFLIIRFGRV